MYQTRYRLLSLFGFLLLLPFMPGVEAQTIPSFEIELEGGPVWQTKNDVQIPNNETGTRFSLAKLAEKCHPGPTYG